MRKNILAEFVKNQRAIRRLTQSELAEKAGVSQGTISKIESGDLVGNYTCAFQIVESLGYEIVFERKFKGKKKIFNPSVWLSKEI